VKTRITLALEAIPAGVACASIAFTTMHNIAQVMLQIGRTGITCRQLGMDALKNRTATKVGIGEGLGTLAKVVGNAGSLGAGLKQAAGIALAGRKLLDKVEWSLHLTVEGPDQAAADRALAALRPLWASTGHEVAPSVPIAMLARPYSIRGILGINGERWLPVHGVFPPSQVASVVQATEAFFARHAERLARHQIDHSFIMVGARAHWVLEPMFYWRDEIGALQRHVLGSKAGKFSGLQADPEARAVVRELRSELSTLFSTLGAVHSQLGKFYEFDHNLRPDTRALLTAIKDTIDPTHQLNPGNLGWK
jgi:D-lactate dehydrogenase (cytochrome)